MDIFTPCVYVWANDIIILIVAFSRNSLNFSIILKSR